MRDVTHLYRSLWIGSEPAPGRWDDACDMIYFVAEERRPNPRDYPGVDVRFAGFNDGAFTAHDRQMAIRAAKSVARNILRGRRVLVTCAMGRNRSALVCAIAIHIVSGRSGRRCAELVHRKRVDLAGVRALQNQAFVRFLETLPAA